MLIGVPTEIKNNENRVAITPAGVHELTARGHEVLIQSGAGVGSGISRRRSTPPSARRIDRRRRRGLGRGRPAAQGQGADRRRVPAPARRPGPLHLPAPRRRSRAVHRRAARVRHHRDRLRDRAAPDRSLPLLQPMSEVAGRLAPQVGAYHLMKSHGGAGMLLGGVPGTPKAKVVVIGGGVAGEHAAANALGMGADVTIVDISIPRLRQLEARFGGAIQTRAVDRRTRSPNLVARRRPRHRLGADPRREGSEARDGCHGRHDEARVPCSSTSPSTRADASRARARPRTTTRPSPCTTPSTTASRTCPARCPAPRPARSPTRRCPTSSRSPTRAGRRRSRDDPALALGLNVHDGKVYNKGVADAFGMDAGVRSRRSAPARPCGACARR